MIDRVQVAALIAVPLVCVAVSLVVAGEPLSMTWLTSYGMAIGATVASLSAFDKWLWKWPLLQGWFVRRPILEGEWQFEITSLWEEPTTRRRLEPIPAFVTIKQTYSRLHLELKTAESKGSFVSERIVQKEDGQFQLTGIFRNEPGISFQEKSRTHLGALVLDVAGKASNPAELTGHYWTDRDTSGELSGKRTKQQ